MKISVVRLLLYVRRFAQILLLLLFAQYVFAQEAAITLDGEPFTKKFVGSPPNGDRLLEFVRENETFEKWTKLVGYRYQQLPVIGNDPKKVAAGMAQIVKAINPKAQSRVIVNEKIDEAILDFLTWPADQQIIEFNIFRYAKSNDGKAVVSLQLAYRFTDSSPEGIEKFKTVRDAWLKQALAFDMRNVQAAVAGPPAATSLGNLTIMLDDEAFSKKMFNALPQGDKQLRFVRESETFEKWEKMVAFKRQSFGADPNVVANRMAQMAMLSNGQAQARVFVDEGASEAYVDYKAWPEGDHFTEFNVYRFAKSADGKAVVALHFARRIPQGSIDAEELKRIRESWIRQAHSFNMKSVFVALGE